MMSPRWAEYTALNPGPRSDLSTNSIVRIGAHLVRIAIVTTVSVPVMSGWVRLSGSVIGTWDSYAQCLSPIEVSGTLSVIVASGHSFPNGSSSN